MMRRNIRTLRLVVGMRSPPRTAGCQTWKARASTARTGRRRLRWGGIAPAPVARAYRAFGANTQKCCPAVGARSMHHCRAMKLRTTIMCTLALGILATAPTEVPAGGPTDILRPAIDRVLHILADPALKGAEHVPERRGALQAVMEGVIDFPDSARRALGVHWQGRTEAERDDFVALFTDLVTYSYIVTMEGYAGQSVVFVSETESDGVMTVLTKVQNTQGTSVPIEYRMHQRSGQWLVYDVIVEGVSLVANYRTQF